MTGPGRIEASTPNIPVGKGRFESDPGAPSSAWQFRVKSLREQEDLKVGDRWWEGLDLTLSRSRVEPLSRADATPFIKRYEWLGTMPTISRFCFGIYFERALGGVVVFGDEYSENLGVWDKYGFTGRMLLLARGASAHWTPSGTSSRLIRRAMRMLPPKYEVITATVDWRAGEVGTIYQAAGFVFSGVMQSHGSRNSFEIHTDGKIILDREARSVFGTRSIVKLREQGLDVRVVPSKSRYFAFRGPNREGLKKAIPVKPYPKRAAETEGGANGPQ